MRTLLRTITLLGACAFASVAQAKSFRTVVIDPGHGGHDKGGQWGRVYEKHLALDTALRLEAHLKKMGFNTFVTRRSDYFISLPQRVTIANRYRNAIFVSIHYNYTWKQQVSGLETFYNRSDSQKLAQFVQQGMINRVHCIDRGAKYARFYVIRHTEIPAVLAECGFVSNQTERDRMKSAWYRDTLAKGIAEGIQRFRNEG
ncbi:N-acetylmuramoyl-L-alanine amidase [Luteolibacter pohnpeiensis]|uniref:N-acetylmuramoyl-L-alanine amidase n=1 Tax=Luteolibacter pohnpeiensis TaxID=454153 RepID=A0A934S8Q4_9BACT|nr:N-acetylmuramoyl-L-alanine amidase [Luteolibacter pohnpeiensis]MBK1883304.1 N-acetylmuramoyl-L-alanine amidase [Luteolibacter pohnpeiensis]